MSNLRVLPPRPRDEGWRNLLQKADKGQSFRCNATNAILVLTYHPAWAGLLAWDAFAERVVFTREPPWEREVSTARRPYWTENDMCRLVDWFAREFVGPSMQMKASTLESVIVTVAAEHETHPVRAYLAALRWDLVQRLPTWLPHYCGAPETPYSAAVGVRWMVQAVARVMVPGCQADSMLILESEEQGTGKSSGLRALVPNPEWFSDTGITIGDKDSYQALHGIWIQSLDELDSMRRAESSKNKSFLTATKDHYRPPYARMARDFPRQCVFAGTTNETEYFQDRTGNRRFWPVRVRRIDVAGIARDRDQLWAEARTRYESGEKWHADTPELVTLLGGEQEERIQADPWQTLIRDWMANPRTREKFDLARGIQTEELLEHAVRKLTGHWTEGDQKRVVACLRGLKHARLVRSREDGVRVRRYLPDAPK